MTAEYLTTAFGCKQCHRPFDSDVGAFICECEQCRWCGESQPDGWLFPFCAFCGEFDWRPNSPTERAQEERR